MEIDRRAALKARHRRAILDAARDLITETGSARFGADQLAERADVSRRTIFNHFSSVDDIVITVCTEYLGAVIDSCRELITAGSGRRLSGFDTVVEALRATDVPGTIVFLWRALGGFDDDPRAQPIFQATFSRTTVDLARELVAGHPGLDPLEAEVMVATLIHGTEVIALHWIADTGASLDPAARAHWHDLLERLITITRTGY